MDKNKWSWNDFLAERHKREDEGVAKRFSQYAYLGKGHLRLDLIKVKLDEVRYFSD